MIIKIKINKMNKIIMKTFKESILMISMKFKITIKKKKIKLLKKIFKIIKNQF